MAISWGGFNQSDVPSFGGGQLGNAYQNATLQQLSGQLSPTQIQLMNNQFNQDVSKINGGAFGMPVGAQQSLLTNAASTNALNYGNLGEQNIQAGQQAAIPYMQGQYQGQLGQFEASQSPAAGGILGQGLSSVLGAIGGGMIPGLGGLGSMLMGGLGNWLTGNTGNNMNTATPTSDNPYGLSLGINY